MRSVQRVPSSVPGGHSNEYDAGLTFRKAIFQPFRTAVPATFVIDLDSCLNDPPNYLPCQRCVQECHVNAIHFDVPLQKPFTREVSAIVLAAGFDIVDVDGLDPYGYGAHPDILTAIELERLFTVSGVTGGFVSKPSNEEEPERVLVVVCDNTPFTWTYAASQATRLLNQEIGHVAMLHASSAPSLINPADYLASPAREKVALLKGQVKTVEPTDDNTIRVEFSGANGAVSEEYDMVVLASAVRPPEGLGGLAEILGVALGPEGYVVASDKGGERVATSRPGVYASGCVTGPKNILATVKQSSMAAQLALSHVGGQAKPAQEAARPSNGHESAAAPVAAAKAAPVDLAQQMDTFVQLLIKLGEGK